MSSKAFPPEGCVTSGAGGQHEAGQPTRHRRKKGLAGAASVTRSRCCAAAAATRTAAAFTTQGGAGLGWAGEGGAAPFLQISSGQASSKRKI